MNTMPRVMLAAALVLACSGDAGTAACGSGASATSVRACDNFFAPASSPIVPGGAVTWTWGGANPHNVTFEDGQSSSPTQASGTHSRTFPGGGTFRYRCTIHSANFDAGMVGVVSVQ